MDWYILALISAVFSAFAAIAEKKSLFKISALDFCAILSLFSFAFSIPFLFLFDISLLTYSALIILFVKSVFNAIAFYSVMSALKNLDISNSLPLMNFTPGLVALVALIFLNEVLSLGQIVGLVLLMIGTYIININKNNKISFLDPFIILFKSKGYKFIIIALLAFTFTSILDKFIVANLRMAPEAFIFFQQFFNVFLFVIPSFIIKKKSFLRSINFSWRMCGKYILLVAFLTIGYRYTQILALKTGRVALVLALKRLSIFFACLIGGKLFNEIDLKRRLVATIILIIGALFVVIF
jgi:drug/metabolite transporter (DMT)-like permease